MSDWKEKDTILDYEYTQDQTDQINEKHVIWSGSPCLHALINHPEMDEGRNRRYFYGILVLVFPFITGLLLFWFSGSIIASCFITVMAVLFMIAFIPPYFLFNRYLKSNETKYWITAEEIIFNIDNGFQENKYRLSWNEVTAIRFKEHPQNLMAIQLMTSQEPSFVTFNFLDKEPHQFPTLELLEKGDEVYRILMSSFKAYKNND